MATGLAVTQIRICAVAPAIGEAGLPSAFMGFADAPGKRQRLTSTIPSARMSWPQDIVSATLSHARDGAEFITGVVSEVDASRCA